MLRFIKSARTSDLATGAGSAFIIQVIGLGLGYVSTILLTRVMGPGEYGVYAYGLSVVLILLSVGATANQQLTIRFVPEYVSTENWAAVKGIMRYGARNMILIGLGIAGLGSALLLIWPGLVRVEYHRALLIALWILPVWMILRIYSSATRAYGKITRTYLPQRALRPLGLAVVGAAALIMGRALSGAQVTFISLIILIILVALQFLFYLQIRPPELRHVQPKYHSREWSWIALPLFVSAIAAAIQTDGATVIVGTLMTPNDVGLFSIANRISQLATFPFMALSAVVIPRFAPLMVQGDRQGMQKLAQRMAISSTLITAAIVGVLWLSTPLILLLFGPEFAAARTETYLLAASNLVAAASGPGYELLNVTGHQSRAMVVAVISALVQIAATTLGVVYLGSVGAALAVLLTAIISGILQNIVAIRALGVYSAVIFSIPPFSIRRDS